ncbi:MAG: hypothetical protein MJ077_10155 [Oscillospiraceae bacterium]|nr:hypothetical protein [Oscillospiraceae bacterium]
MIKLELELTEVDYNSLMEQLLPYMGDHLRNNGNPLGMLLSNGMSSSMAKRVLATVPQSQKDALVCDLINSNSVKMAQKAEDSAAKHGIAVKISSIHASSK